MENCGVACATEEDCSTRCQGRSNRGLFFAVLAVYTLHFTTGATIAWPSPIIPRLNLTKSENTFVSSLNNLGLAPGQVIASIGLETVGRKGVLYGISMVYISCWIPLLCTKNVIAIYVSRLLSGIAMGASFPCCSLYIAEISDERLRGPLNSLVQSFLAIGFLVEYLVGPYVGFFALSWISMSLIFLSVFLLYFIPESPHFLLARGKVDQAKSALLFLRGAGCPDKLINNEISVIQEAIAAGKTDASSGSQWKTVFTKRSGRRALAIGLFLQLTLFGSAINSVLAYVEYVFERAKIQFPSVLVSVFISLTNLVASLPVPLLVRLLGYKLLFFISCLGCGISMILVAVYFYLLNNGFETSNLSFLPVVGIVIYNIFFCFAVGPLVWPTVAVLFAPSVRGLALGICGLFSALLAFLYGQVFSIVLQEYGVDSVYFGFGTFLGIIGIVCLFIVPDTSRMSLKEIQDYLSS